MIVWAGRVGFVTSGKVGTWPTRRFGLWPASFPRRWEVVMDHHPLAASLLSRPSFDVIAWVDPVCDSGFPCDSDKALVVLCPVLGPSALVVLHRLARYASSGPTSWQPDVFASTFGLSTSLTATGLAVKAVARLARFGFVRIGDSVLEVRTRVPALPQRWIASLPKYLRDDPTIAA